VLPIILSIWILEHDMKRWSAETCARICFVLAVFISGCSGSVKGGADLSKLVPMTGTVKLDGKPVVGATVTFVPKMSSGPGTGFAAAGITDDSGKYELAVDSGDGKTKKGVIPGGYNIIVSKFTKMDGSPVTFDPAKEGPMSVGAIESIPMQYSTVSPESLTTIVSTSGGTFDIDMQSQ